MFGLDSGKLIVLAVIAAVILGPRRLPELASRLATLVKSARHILDDLQQRAREELGPAYEDLDWKKLDPRQYDPRQIIREALMEEDAAVSPNVASETQLDTPRTPAAPMREPVEQSTQESKGA